MSKVNKGQLRLLAPYLEGGLEGGPTHENVDESTGVITREWNMVCPLHEDSKRSASLNVDKGEWYCFAGCGGGRVTELIRMRANWVPPGAAALNGHSKTKKSNGQVTRDLPSAGTVAGWNSSLLSNELRMEYMLEARGITTDTVTKFQIGWDQDKKVYTIPVYDAEGTLLNVRFYDPNPNDEMRKIWGVPGHNTPVLYPVQILADEVEDVDVVEGEWDALVNIQNGYPAITRTGAADVWHGSWNEHFAGKRVWIGHDKDEKGAKADRKVGRALSPVADVYVYDLPYAYQDKHGKDWTDFWLEHNRDVKEKLRREAKPYGKKKTTSEEEIETLTVLDTFDARRAGDPAKVIVTVRGRAEPGYSIPKRARLACTQDAGTKCVVCPLNAAKGEAVVEVTPDNPLVLALMDATNDQVREAIRDAYGAQKCTRLQIETEEAQSVEVLYARPSLDHTDGSATDRADDHKNIKITSVGRHDTMANNTVMATGALHPNPRSQKNEFLSWDVHSMETSVDRFELNNDTIKLMKKFQTKGRPLKKLADINKDVAAHITRIQGRPEMHALMDLTFHSVLSFFFAGDFIQRGWLEALIVGDTGTGKSSAARRLVQHYGAGEIVNCEAASFAGVVGGLQQMGGRNDWVVTWGVIPLNDKRIVILDEISGLTVDEIASMSDIRSSGQAKLVKVQQEQTWSRTRLIWMGNPRDADMSRFTYGVDAVKPLIGNAEDIARFDLAMAVTKYDVSDEVINQQYDVGDLPYTAEACHALLLWAWTRQPEQVVWAPGAEEQVFAQAIEVGRRYTESPPLVLASSVRIKIARVAVALAARLFSTDDTYQNVVVKPEHVDDAVAFMDKLYQMQAFGYAERSHEYIDDRDTAEANREEIRQYLLGRKNLGKFLRNVGKFRRPDLEEILDVSREEANGIISKLWDARMVRKELGDIRVEPTLHALLREGRW